MVLPTYLRLNRAVVARRWDGYMELDASGENSTVTFLAWQEEGKGEKKDGGSESKASGGRGGLITRSAGSLCLRQTTMMSGDDG